MDYSDIETKVEIGDLTLSCTFDFEMDVDANITIIGARISPPDSEVIDLFLTRFHWIYSDDIDDVLKAEAVLYLNSNRIAA